MPAHATNRAIFYQCNANEPLLQLYTTLVAVELALKDRAGSFAHNHEIETLAAPLLGATAATLQAVLTTLDQSLKRLRCTKKGGNGAPIGLAKYPDLRYLRFAKDGFPDGSPDPHVLQALQDAKALLVELRNAGVTP